MNLQKIYFHCTTPSCGYVKYEAVPLSRKPGGDDPRPNLSRHLRIRRAAINSSCPKCGGRNLKTTGDRYDLELLGYLPSYERRLLDQCNPETSPEHITGPPASGNRTEPLSGQADDNGDQGLGLLRLFKRYLDAYHHIRNQYVQNRQKNYNFNRCCAQWQSLIDSVAIERLTSPRADRVLTALAGVSLEDWDAKYHAEFMAQHSGETIPLPESFAVFHNALRGDQ